MPAWTAFQHSSTLPDYSGNKLQAAWNDLHRGDCQPWPDPAWAETCVQANPDSLADITDPADAAQRLQSAWAAFHKGDFEQAHQAATSVGLLGHSCQAKAAGIYASYLETDESQKQALFLAVIESAEQARALLPDDHNSHYFLAFSLGRYSQSISIMEALRKGYGGRIQEALQHTLTLCPEHAEAHTAMGMYHAEIINKVGKMVGKMTYGASADKALEHFEQAVTLTPQAPVAHLEYGNGLYLMFGDKRLDEVSEHYEKAADLPPKDAMEALDVAAAMAEFE